MQTNRKLKVSNNLAVFRPRVQRTDDDLKGLDVIELAILGAVAGRMTSLAELIDTVKCLAGEAWNPATEVIKQGIQVGVAKQFIHSNESWILSIPFLYSITGEGAKRLSELLELPLPSFENPIIEGASEVKFGLLDKVNSRNILSIAEDLEQYYRYAKQKLEERRNCSGEGRSHLSIAIAARIESLNLRLRVIGDIRNHRQ